MMTRLFIAIAVLWPLALTAAPVRIAVISDMNDSYGSTDYSPDVTRAVRRIIELKPDLVLNTGDMVGGQRPNPHLSEAEVGAMWNAFHADVTDPLTAAGIPVLPTPGNHDASAYSGFELERHLYDRTWTRHPPAVEFIDGERYPFRYAARYAGILLISLDVTTVGTQPVEETEWLDQILKEEGAGSRAVVIFSHLPVYPFSQGRETEISGDPTLVTILGAQSVDLYLSGHHHAYYPGVADGILFIGQACLGAGPRRLVGDTAKSRKAFTMVQIADDGTIDEFALAAPDFTHAIPLTTLPPAIGPLIRRDLAAGWR